MIVETHAVRRRKQRQEALAQLHGERTATRDRHRICQRLRDVREQRAHFVLRLEILLDAKFTRSPFVREDVPLRDAHPRLVRLEILAAQELHRMRRHYRQSGLARQPRRLPHVCFVLHPPGALQLDVIGIREQFRPFARQRRCQRRVALRERLPHVARERPRQAQQPARRAVPEPRLLQHGASVRLVLHPRPCEQFAQLPETGAMPADQQRPRRLPLPALVLDPDICANDGLHAPGARVSVELDHAKQIGEIGNPQCGHTVGGGSIERVINPNDAVRDRKFGMQTQVDETGGVDRGDGSGSGGIHRRILTEASEPLAGALTRGFRSTTTRA